MSLSSTTCYWPNGQEVNDADGFEPCNSGRDPNHAACCQLRSSVCTTNGYCVGDANYVYRGACTDRSWGSSSCPQFCAFEEPGNQPFELFTNFIDCNNGTIVPLSDRQWCCSDTNGGDCCGSSFYVAFGTPYTPQSVLDKANDSTTSTTSSSSSSSTLVEDLTPGSSTTNAASSGQNSGSEPIKIGVGVGVGVGVGSIIFGLLIYFILRERKRRIAAEQRIETALMQGQPSSSHKPEMDAHNQGQGFHRWSLGVTQHQEMDAHREVQRSNPRSTYEVQGD